MDESKFTQNKTGRLVPIAAPDKDFAFVPDPLPPKWTFNENLWVLLAEANRCVGELDGVARTLPNPELFLKPLQRVESITSSRLEGTYATAQELMLFELNPFNAQGDSDQLNAWREVANYNLALSQACTLLTDFPICLRVLRDTHRTLLTGVRGSSKNPGEFRTHQVHIGSNRRYVPPPPEEAIKCLNEFEVYLNNTSDSLHPLVRCFVAHYQLEAIHPFSDGNGRVGRVWLSLMMYKWCQLKMPWLYMSPFFERYKDEYIDKMFKVSSEGAWGDWVEFCLRGVISQARKAANLCDDLRALRDSMHSRVEHSRGGRIHPIIEGLFESPYVRIVDLAKRFKVRYMTARGDVHYLVEKGILRELPEVKISTYFAPEIFKRAYLVE